MSLSSKRSDIQIWSYHFLTFLCRIWRLPHFFLKIGNLCLVCLPWSVWLEIYLFKSWLGLHSFFFYLIVFSFPYYWLSPALFMVFPLMVWGGSLDEWVLYSFLLSAFNTVHFLAYITLTLCYKFWHKTSSFENHVSHQEELDMAL